jgi:hypothetical protein
VSGEDFAALRRAAGAHAPEAAQGAAFAAKARIHAGNLESWTEAACRELCGRPAGDAARVTDLAAEDLRPETPGGETPYEAWRAGIQARLARETRAA